ncbi:AraC family transcriptional regulator [Carnobacterium maltaromaticum]|uniref:AraC family transcriptional regulator n=1 Tax=Carnobacterium maltaromaticum TaxID=2751 RepID=A0AAW9K6K4_CARML|nr:AraC family transcriptional regulator [Carnobacterium maltaromaticum]MDZ5760240.1 AraC family transcriptional regulator [Carnobacterium maltaromaticum]
MLSFTDQSHFIKVFKKIKNQTPKDYQRRNKKV